MKIYLASDHAGFELKEKIKKFLADSGYTVEDFGAHTLDPDDDYPDYIRKAAEAVAECERARHLSRACRGIVFGGTGQGEAMVANRVEGARAAVLYSFREDVIRLSREHNNANMLSIGARFVNEEEALRAVRLWLETPFSGDERHARRLAKF